MTEDKQNKLLEMAGKRICDEMKGSVHAIEGIPIVTFRFPEDIKKGRYRKGAANAGQEIELAEVYMGKSGKLIFCFEPCDARDWEAIELDPKSLDNVLPLFGAELGQKVGSESEALPVILHELVIQCEMEEEERIRKEQAEKQNAYVENPNYGRF